MCVCVCVCLCLLMCCIKLSSLEYPPLLLTVIVSVTHCFSSVYVLVCPSLDPLSHEQRTVDVGHTSWQYTLAIDDDDDAKLHTAVTIMGWIYFLNLFLCYHLLFSPLAIKKLNVTFLWLHVAWFFLLLFIIFKMVHDD